MNLEELQQEWKIDTKINELDLSRESLKTPHLHSKYIDHLVGAKRRLSRAKHDLARMAAFKVKYWSGHLTKEELIEYELPQYQYTKPLKSEVEGKLLADEDYIKILDNIEGLEIMIGFLESVMKSIFARSFDIKNSIEWGKFQAGN